MQQNEMFILGMENADMEEALKLNNKTMLSDYLYLVWSISEGDYWFRHHLETKNAEIKNIQGARESKRFYRIKSLKMLFSYNPVKVKLDPLGNISL
jgi:CRISPR-associated endonuclease Csn1